MISINPTLSFRPEQARHSAEDWLMAFEAALVSRDVARIGALFHAECHWRDVLAFTWHVTPLEGRDNVAARLAAEQARTAARGFHVPAGRKPPRTVKRLGIDSIEAIFEVQDGGRAWRRHHPPCAGSRRQRHDELGCSRRRCRRWRS